VEFEEIDPAQLKKGDDVEQDDQAEPPLKKISSATRSAARQKDPAAKSTKSNPKADGQNKQSNKVKGASEDPEVAQRKSIEPTNKTKNRKTKATPAPVPVDSANQLKAATSPPPKSPASTAPLSASSKTVKSPTLPSPAADPDGSEPSSAGGLTCSGCNQTKPKTSFSSAQLKKKTKRRCTTCTGVSASSVD